MIAKIWHSFRNAWGHLRGHKGCLNCGATWNYKKGKRVRYTVKGSGFSALKEQTVLCFDCWDSTSPAERLEYHRDHCALEAEQGRPVSTVEWYAITEKIMMEGR